MTFSVIRPCTCGSKEPSEWAYDAQGIELARVCSICRKEKLSRYRPEILGDGDRDPRIRGYTQEDVNEPIEPDT